MNKSILFSLALLLTPTLARPQDAPELKETKQKVSYSMGANIGNSWKRQDIEVDLEAVIRGLRDALDGKPLALSDQEMRKVMTAFQTEMRTKQMEKRRVVGDKNKQEGEAFLAENKKKEGVITLPSGLQYKVLNAGTGPKPTTADTVVAHYRGTLIDGTEFDSSYKRGEPTSFGVTGVIKGWTEALQLMNTGSKWQLFIPSALAYGENGAGPQIGANATLIFEVELVAIKPPAKAAEPVTSDIIKVPSAEELKKGAKIEVIKKEDLDKQKK